MVYRRITLDLIVMEDEADAVVAELNLAMDRMDEKHTLFGGDIETGTVEHSGTRRKSALMHTRAAGKTAAAALRLAGEKVAGAYKRVI